MTQDAKAKARAAEKARHKGLSLQPTGGDGQEELADTGDGAPSAGSKTAPKATDDTKSYKDLPDNIRNTYDKKLLLKRSKLQRMQYSRRALHHYDLSAPKHTDATRDARHLRKHPKGSKKKGEPREEKELRQPAEPTPAPDPTQPTPAKSAKPKQPSAPKQKQPKAPKPDPTQPPGGN